MPSMEINVDFEVFCDCGENLSVKSNAELARRGGGQVITVPPCSKCCADTFDQGLKAGRDEA